MLECFPGIEHSSVFLVLRRCMTEQKRDAQRVQDQLNELLRRQDVMLNREDRVQALKGEVNELLAKHGQPPRYFDPGAP